MRIGIGGIIVPSSKCRSCNRALCSLIVPIQWQVLVALKKKKWPFSRGITVDNKAPISKTISLVFTMDRPHNDRHRRRSFHVRVPSSGLILIRRPHSRHQILLTLHQWLEGMEGAGEAAGGELVDKRQLGWGEGGGCGRGGQGGQKRGNPLRCP